jgi:imidazolonepropionase-like amidohydrolase
VNGSVLDASGGVIDRGNVGIGGSLIEIFTDAELPSSWEDEALFDCAGMTVLPGLIDLHVHLYGHAEPDKQFATTEHPALLDESPAYLAAGSVENARRTLEAGFTTIRDMGAPGDINIDVARAVNGGIALGPRIVSTSTIEMSRAPGTHETHGAPGLGYTGADEVVRAVREKISAGAEVIHLVATGAQFGQFSPRTSLLNRDELRAAAQEAHKLGALTTANAPGASGARDSVLAGVQCIEHGEYLCEDAEIFSLMTESEVGYVPTLITVTAKLQKIAEAQENGTATGLPELVVSRTLESEPLYRRSFELAMEAGVLVAIGTDVGAPFTPNGTNADELKCFVDFGATEIQAIEAATKLAAKILRLDDRIGTIEAGKEADLVVVRGDPTRDITILQDVGNIVLVIKGGEIVVDRLGLTNGFGGEGIHSSAESAHRMRGIVAGSAIE